VKLYYATDLHAGETCFRKFLNSAKFYGANALICGGDLSGKMVVPIIKTARGVYEATYYGSTVKIKKELEVVKLIRNLRNAGFYTIIVTEAELDRYSEDDAKRITKEQTSSVLEGWIKMADERLKAHDVPCIVMPGNDDPDYIDSILDGAAYIQNGGGKVLRLLDCEVLSLPYAIPSPFKYPRDIPEDELAEKIDALAADVINMDKCIFNIHIPPYDTDCDVGVIYNEDLSPVVDGGELAMDHIGSKAVRTAIEKYQPLLALGGHIHECRGISKIGRTICVNPGSDYDQGSLKGALIDISGDKVKYTLTAG